MKYDIPVDIYVIFLNLFDKIEIILQCGSTAGSLHYFTWTDNIYI